MTTHRLRPLTSCEPARRTTPRRRALVSVPPPDPQLALDLTPRTELLRRPVPGTLDRRQVGRLVTAILEAYDGLRPAGQVRPIVAPELFPQLLHGDRGHGPHHHTRNVHTCHPAEGAVEACVTVDCGPRMLALAARFERGTSGWRCTRFQLLEPRVTQLRLSA
ncbi:Rv3235 family protein [Amycolatopsis sp. H20-H5]|uniref:Rv3235 family protein n=1 Tax=Amycolatopsis sp. H20-H5 TaxID=3046309 RepID=UPI002DB8CBBB|nr:Rv3235 family protein [Amycolatopsis sp. H20-H5]MEC3980680.1 Rv3235 family protein [Amycolatopsis sp. H20-H5]